MYNVKSILAGSHCLLNPHYQQIGIGIVYKNTGDFMTPHQFISKLKTIHNVWTW